jgi:hypothetical protein
VAGQGGHLRQRLLDALAGVDRDRDHGQVLGQGEQPLGLKVLAGPEPLRTAQQHAGRELVASVAVQQGVGQEPAAGLVVLGRSRW